MTWTKFWDMHSGGGAKEQWTKIYIEAPQKQAEVIFYNRFGHDPHRITCTCCGRDYSIDEGDSLEQLSGYHRNCQYGYVNSAGQEVDEKDAYNKKGSLKRGYKTQFLEKLKTSTFPSGPYLTLNEYLKDPEVLVIRKEDIKPEEYEGELFEWDD